MSAMQNPPTHASNRPPPVARTPLMDHPRMIQQARSVKRSTGFATRAQGRKSATCHFAREPWRGWNQIFFEQDRSDKDRTNRPVQRGSPPDFCRVRRLFRGPQIGNARLLPWRSRRPGIAVTFIPIDKAGRPLGRWTVSAASRGLHADHVATAKLDVLIL
jgi:hypothetical protein